MSKNASIGIKIVKGKIPERDRISGSIPSKATRAYEDNPATGKGSSDRTVKKGE